MKFLKKIILQIVLILSFLLLSYVFFKSEIYWDGSRRQDYFIYYFFSTSALLISVIAFFVNEKLKEYFLIIFFSFFLALYCFEGFLIFKQNYNKEQQIKKNLYEKKFKEKWDTRTLSEIYNDLKSTNNKITIRVFPTVYKHDHYKTYPLSGISNSPTIYCNENGYYSIYESDRYGFNNPDEIWDSDYLEYVVLGDSFVHGACVNRPYDISSVLRTLSGKNILNLGYGANGPLIEYATLREYLDKNVKKILWVYFEGNDLKDLRFEKNNKILSNYLFNLNYSQNLKFKQDEVNSMARNIIEKQNKKFNKIINLKLIDFIKASKTRNLILPKIINIFKESGENNYNPYPIYEFKKILQYTKNIATQKNAKLFFVYLPEYKRYSDKSYKNYNYILIKKLLKELEISMIDIHEDFFAKEKDPLNFFPFGLHGHYTPNGYRKVAEIIYNLTTD